LTPLSKSPHQEPESVSKSADETAEVGEPLDEDSDVIELTDEVPAADTTSGMQDASPDDELDVLTREMPEFRVPEGSQQSNDADASDDEIVELRETVKTVETGGPAAIPNAAIISGRGRTAKKDTDTNSDESADAPSPSEEGDSGAADAFAAEPAPDAFAAEPAPTDQDAAASPQQSADDEAPETPDASEADDAGDDGALEADDADDAGAADDDAGADDDEAVAPNADAIEDGGEVAYDRQAMVKTIQMNAIDRREFERHVQAEELDESVLLADQRYAPDVLVFPPRVLTTRWKEGGPLLRAGKVSLPDDEPPVQVEAKPADEEAKPADEEAKPADEEAKPADKEAKPADDEPPTMESPSVDETLEDDELPEIEPDAVELELDSEAIEDAEVKPPPKPKDVPPQKRPPAGERKPPGQGKPPAQEDDEELSGLVQELLDESKQGRSAKKAQKPQSPRQTWFKKVFTEEYLRTLPRDIHRQTRREADFIEESFNLDDNDRVLDLACGFGRHAIELTRRGYEVAGLDLSMPLLQKALNEAKKQSLSIKFIHGDMRELNFESIFNACYLWQTSFGYFDEQTNFRVLRGIHRALAPKGRLLIDVLNRDHIAAEMPHRLWWEGVDCVFLEEVDLDHKSSVLHTKRSFIYEDGSPPLEQNTFIRIYSLHELVHLLEAAGFAVREVSGELHQRGHFLGPASSRIIIQAQKRPPRRKRG
jgi:SAM-dependent methyltransferase